VEGRVTLPVTETPIFVEGELTARCAAGEDLDCDCDVDVADISHVAARWQSQEGDSDYERTSDLNDDGQINVVDVMAVSVQWGAVCPGNT
ncbi:MAG: dockerin type I domain-containing protein, partial [Anaerolineae bacterium]